MNVTGFFESDEASTMIAKDQIHSFLCNEPVSTGKPRGRILPDLYHAIRPIVSPAKNLG